MFLFDTNVILELRKAKPHGAVTAWVDTLRANQMYLPAIVIGEIQAGIEQTRRQDKVKAAQFESWLSDLIANFEVIALDAEVCREWGRLMHGKSRELQEDAFVAATARVHNLVVATRNVADFEHFEVKIFNPFKFEG
jgi:predicted nucleic acid-binding protein